MMSEYYFERTNRMFISNRRIDNGYSHPLHFHDGCEIYLLNKGDATFNFENFSFKMSHGSMVVIPPYVPHSSVCDSSVVYDRMVISMKQEYVKKLCTPNTDLTECFKRQSDCSKYAIVLDDEQLSEIMRLQHKLDGIKKDDMFGSDVLHDAYAAEFLVLVNRAMKYNSFTGDNAMPEIVHKILSWMIKNRKEVFSMENLANDLHMSGSYLSRKFKEYMGIPIRQYIVQKRVEEACYLLRMGENVTNACYSAGFNDYANFIRTFKNVIGMTPGEYAKKSI